MSKRYLALAAFAAGALLATPASAQSVEASASASDTSSSTSGTSSTNVSAEERTRLKLNFLGEEFSVGWRVWAMGVPRFLVSPFVKIQGDGWGGGLNVATGPEFVYRNRGLDIVLSAMYVGYNADPAIFRGVNEPEASNERIEARLFGVYATAHFLWGLRIHPMFEIQLGAGLGVGYIGGNLYRTQAKNVGGTWVECQSASDAPECSDPPNNHLPGQPAPVGDPNNGGRYREPNWFNGGSLPAVLPWVSLPHVAFHLRPHRNVDLKLEGGYAIIGFYGGLSAHYVF